MTNKRRKTDLTRPQLYGTPVDSPYLAQQATYGQPTYPPNQLVHSQPSFDSFTQGYNPGNSSMYQQMSPHSYTQRPMPNYQPNPHSNYSSPGLPSTASFASPNSGANYYPSPQAMNFGPFVQRTPVQGHTNDGYLHPQQTPTPRYPQPKYNYPHSSPNLSANSTYDFIPSNTSVPDNLMSNPNYMPQYYANPAAISNYPLTNPTSAMAEGLQANQSMASSDVLYAKPVTDMKKNPSQKSKDEETPDGNIPKARAPTNKRIPKKAGRTIDLTKKSAKEEKAFQVCALQAAEMSQMEEQEPIIQEIKELPTESCYKSEYEAEWLSIFDYSVFIGRYKSPIPPSVKVAAFDLDETLITTQGTNPVAKNVEDWKFILECIPQKLKSLHSEGYRIMIFTNQGTMDPSKKLGSEQALTLRQQSFFQKMDHIFATVGVPMTIMASATNDRFRKPRYGMWEIFQQLINNVEIDKGQSFFVGDAAGRPQDWKSNILRDFGDIDRKFALNAGIRFYTPEEYFQNAEPQSYELQGFCPHRYIKEVTENKIPEFMPNDASLFPINAQVEILILVGLPASGKSRFTKQHLIPRGYAYINQILLGTRSKCLLACKAAIKGKKPVVIGKIDNCNPDDVTRGCYISLANKFDVPVRCFHFMANDELSMHNNYVRAFGASKASRSLVPALTYRSYRSRIVTPEISEGFDEIKLINFIPEFETEEEKIIWNRYYM